MATFPNLIITNVPISSLHSSNKVANTGGITITLRSLKAKRHLELSNTSLAILLGPIHSEKDIIVNSTSQESRLKIAVK